MAKVDVQDDLFIEEEINVKETKKPDPVVNDKPDEPDSGDDEIVKTLRIQLEEAQKTAQLEKTARESAEAARQEAEKAKATANNDAATAFQKQVEAQRTSIANAIAAALAEQTSAEQEYERAEEIGDVKAKIAAQKKLAKATYLSEQWDNEKVKFDAWEEDYNKNEEARKNTPQPAKASEKTQAWIDAHPRFNTDEDYRDSAHHFHRIAIKKGLIPDTKGYFDYIEAGLDRMYAEPKKETKKIEVPDEEDEGIPASSIAASPSREGPVIPNEKQTRIRLTKSEYEIVKNAAERDKMTVEKAAERYIKNKKRLIDNGIIQGNA